MNVYDSIMTGLTEAVTYEQGKGKAKRVSLTVEPLPEFEASEIREIRVRTGFTQAIFAAILGVSPKTVEAWEAGTNHPAGSAKRMLSLMRSDPELIEKYHLVIEN